MNYLDKVLKTAAETANPYNLKVYHFTILHDEWCGIFKGKPCDCNPEVRDFTQYCKSGIKNKHR